MTFKTIFKRFHSWRFSVIVGTLAALALLLAACATATSPSATPAGSGTGPATVTLVPAPNPPVANQEATFTVRVVDGSGQGVTGAKVNVSAKHLEMGMGTVTSDATEVRDGIYAARATLTMPGTWTVSVIAQAGGVTRKADFDLTVT